MSDMIEVETTVVSALTGETRIIRTMEPLGAEPTPSVEDFRAAVQSHIDATAQSRLYDSGNSIATYATSTNQSWAAEAQAFIVWRDAVWSQVYALWADPPDPQPTVDALIQSLPTIEWPDA